MTNTSLSVGLAPVRDLLVLVGRAQGGGGGLLGVELGQGGGAGSVHLHTQMERIKYCPGRSLLDNSWVKLYPANFPRTNS